MAVLFDGLGFRVTIRSWQLLLMANYNQKCQNSPLEGDGVRISRLEKMSRNMEKGQECQEMR